VHGGAWSAGDRTNDQLIAHRLAESGLVVVSIDFRLAPAHRYPASMTDLNYAMRWLKTQAPTLGAVPWPLGAIGSSSGGHMTMLSALRPSHPTYADEEIPGAGTTDASVAYVLALWPILDPLARYRYAQETGRDELVRRTEGYFGASDNLEDANPQRILDRGESTPRPPVLIIQGTADENLPLAIPQRFAATYRAAGGSAELELFPGMPHGFANKPGPETERALGLMAEFIARQLRSTVNAA
jgi:acetyl esterase/lipase